MGRPPLSVAATLRLLSLRYPFTSRASHRSFSTASPPPAHGSSHPHSQAHPHRVAPSDHASVLRSLPLSSIRNFSIIAHIDHGKSTLADRLLELTGNVPALHAHQAQVLDHLQVERERGITVKAQTASLLYTHRSSPYLLNLIDTPGHVDFSYEVSRSLAACQGVLLLVDASQGIQAQTLANHHSAVQLGLTVIPVLSKVDLPHADVARVTAEMTAAFGVKAEDVLCISSKTGQGIDRILPAVIERIAPPVGRVDGELRALLFDSWYDHHRGCVLLLRVMDGEVAKGDKVASFHSNCQWEVQEVGLLTPQQREVDSLRAGSVGYLIAGIRNTRDASLGDTIYKLAGRKHRGLVPQQQWQAARAALTPLPGFRKAKAMVFAGIFPSADYTFDELCVAVDKLCLNDASVQVEKESSAALGMGLRVGFLGLLHMGTRCLHPP